MMRCAPSQLRATALWLAVTALASSTAAFALQEGTTPSGSRYVSGGVSDRELADMQARRGQFSLWIVTAARKSGAWLSGVRVTVTDVRHRVVFDGTLDGPWLMLDLPLGRYDVEARMPAEWQTRVTTIHPGDHHQAVFYFDVDADVLPPAERRSP